MNSSEAPTKGLAKYTYFVRCMVSGCDSPKDVKYHSFPKDPTIRQEWISACANSENFNPDRSLVCGRHFLYTDYFGCYEGDVKRFPLGIRLKQGVIPHQFIPSMTQNPREKDPEVEVRHRKRIVEEAILEYDSVQERALTGEAPQDKETAIRPKKRSKFELYISNLSTPNYPGVHEEDKNTQIIREKESLLLKKTIKTLRTRVRLLETKVNNLTNTKISYRKKLRRLQSLKGRREVIYEELGKNLTNSQIRYLIDPRSFQRDYSKEEILRGLILRFISPQALRYVKSWNLVSLPSRHTQDIFLQRFQFTRGILQDAIEHIRESLEPLKNPNKSLAILSVAEINLQSCFKLSSEHKKNAETHKTLQIGAVRGLVSDFKKIVFQDFDSKLDKDLLFSIIEELEKNSIQVIGINFNIHTPHLFKELNLSEENTIIVNPTDPNRHILIFPDVPNLLKMLRDHIIEEECLFPDETQENFYPLCKQDFKALIVSEKESVKSVNKISLRHIRCKGEDRRSTRLAAQLLSETTALALANHFENAQDPRASAISIINNWFDVMNSPNGSGDVNSALGVQEDSQLKCLNDMERLIYEMKIPGRSSLLLFQQGILISIMSTKILYQSIVKEESYVSCIQTHRLNQDFIGSLFNRIRLFEGMANLSPGDAITLVKLIVAEHAYLKEDDRALEEPEEPAEEPQTICPSEIVEVKKELVRETICEFDLSIAPGREEIIN